jgi:hypothetical protein
MGIVFIIITFVVIALVIYAIRFLWHGLSLLLSKRKHANV